MKKLILIALLLNLVFDTFGQTFQIPDGVDTVTVKVPAFDADGLLVTSLITGKQYHARMRMIDAPERKGFSNANQRWAYEARDSLRNLIHVGDTLLIDLRPYIGRTRVSFGRPLCDVYTLDGEWLNLIIVEKGWAWFRNSAGAKSPAMVESLKTAFQNAKENKLGLFAYPHVSPWYWRETH